MSRRSALTCLVAFVVALIGASAIVPAPVFAQRAAPSLQAAASFDPPSASIGDRVRFSQTCRFRNASFTRRSSRE